jgi:hypothetical protein
MILLYFIGCIASYFVSRAVLNGKRTIGNVLTSILIALFSWLGLVWLGITWLVYKTLSVKKEF